MEQDHIFHEQGLQEAFSLFNNVSEQLIDSYHELEAKVEKISTESIAAREKLSADLDAQGRIVTRLKNLLESLPAAVIVLDAAGRVQEYNSTAEELLGVDLGGEIWREIIPQIFINSPSEISSTRLHNGRYMSVSTCPLKSGAGQIVHITDVTEVRELQEILNKYKRLSAMGEMVASIAHQIRTPLSSALLYASNLKITEHDTEKTVLYSEKLIKNLKHMDDLVRDMLTYVREGTFSVEDIGISTLLDDVKGIVCSTLDKDIDVHVTDNSENCLIQANKESIITALQNIIINSVNSYKSVQGLTQGQNLTEEKITKKETADKKSVIDIQCRKFESSNACQIIEILVSDQGSGISKDNLDRIFDPFFTADGQGTGLGLSIVKTIISSHGGAIWVDSENGKGTTVGIHLPVHHQVNNKN